MLTAALCSALLALLCLAPGSRPVRLSRALPPRYRAPRRRPGRTRRRERVSPVALCRVLAAELRAGQPPDEALRLSAAEAGLPGVAGADDLRRAASDDPELWALAYLAVCWEVTADTGAGLADVVDSLAAELTEHQERRAEAVARTNGPRTTAALLCVLPAIGILLSAGIGGSPLEFLFTTPLGLACLTAGAALDAAGVWWTLRMVNSATAEV